MANGELELKLVREVDGVLHTLRIDLHDYNGRKVRAVAYGGGPMPTMLEMTPVKGSAKASFDAVVVKHRTEGWVDALEEAAAARVSNRVKTHAAEQADRETQIATARDNFPRTALDRELAALIARPSKVEVVELRGSGDNVVTCVPATIAKLKVLEVLRLEDHGLLELPDELGKIATLRELHVRGNKLQKVPSDVLRIKELVHLDLRDNEIERIWWKPSRKGGVIELAGNALKPAEQYLFLRCAVGDLRKIGRFSMNTDRMFPMDTTYLKHDFPGAKALPATAITLRGRKPTKAETEKLAKMFPKAEITIEPA